MTTEIKGDSNWNSDFATAIALVVDEKPQSTTSGTATAGAWTKRVLNTIRSDAQGIVSLASDEFTLQAGTYEIEWTGSFFGVNRANTRIYNETDASVEGTGFACFTGTAFTNGDYSHGTTIITIASAKAFSLQYRVEATRATNGLGVNGQQQVETFAQVKITKVKS